MRAFKQEVPTPPVEKIEEVVVTMTPEEARCLHMALQNVSWRYVGGDYLQALAVVLGRATV